MFLSQVSHKASLGMRTATYSPAKPTRMYTRCLIWPGIYKSAVFRALDLARVPHRRDEPVDGADDDDDEGGKVVWVHASFCSCVCCC